MVTDQHGQLQTLLNQLRFGDAEAMAQAIVDRSPDNGFAQHVLGALLLKRASIPEALVHLHIAVTLLPTDPQAHNNLACALERSGQSKEAAQSYRRALNLDANFTLAHHNLGVVLREIGRYAESEISLRKALALNPDYTDAHFNLGLTLARRNRTEEAKQCFEQALLRNPAHTHALVALGNAAASMGSFVEAEKLYGRALEIAPDNLAAWSAIPEIRKMTAGDIDWLRASLNVLPACRHPRELSRYNFSVAKFYDDVGDPAQAFAHYQRANEISRQLDPAYVPEQHTATINQICTIFNKERMAQRHPAASLSERPVFIVGMPRSGTTLVEQIIASHPLATGAGELNFWTNAMSQLVPSRDSQDIDQTLTNQLEDAYLTLLEHFSTTSLRVTDKAPQNFVNLGLIATLFPQAKILHLQRNPVDTCLSIYFQDFATAFSYANDLENLAHYYREYQRLMRHWRDVIPSSQLLDIPYDALVADQEGWSRKMIAFIGLEWDQRCIDFQHTKREVGTASQWQVRQGVYKTSIDRWRKYEKFVDALLPLLDADVN